MKVRVTIEVTDDQRDAIAVLCGGPVNEQGLATRPAIEREFRRVLILHLTGLEHARRTKAQSI